LTAAFFCYADEGGPDIGPDGRPRLIREEHKHWFDPAQEPFKKEKARRLARRRTRTSR
jgi:hypothetical protein